jgi:hypothetical protein
MYRHRRMNIKRMMVSNTSYVVLFVLFCVSSFCVLCSTDIVLCFLFVCLRLVSCVQQILCCVFCLFVFVLCLVFNRYCVVFFVCLSSSCVLCMVVSHIYCGVFLFFFCLRLVICVPNVASFSECLIYECPFDFSNVYMIWYRHDMTDNISH